MRSRLKRALLRMSKWLGLFWISRRATRAKVRILCFHGLSVADEANFRPGLFHSTETLRRRLEMIRRKRYPVVPLEDVIEGLRSRCLPPCATVLTFDDGFYSVYRDGIQVLREYSFPATVYVTTYYAVKETPVFRLVVQYMFWKSEQRTLSLSQLGGPWSGRLDLRDEKSAAATMWDIIEHAESNWTEPERVGLSRRLGEELAVDYDRIVLTRMLSLVTPHEIRSMCRQGIDVQLHTHRHRLPVDEALARAEIEENREILRDLVPSSCDHFCYPSGQWCQAHWPWLQSSGVRSATTCDAGLNDQRTPVYALRRILETASMTPIEFEAELCGYADSLRWMRRAVVQAMASVGWTPSPLEEETRPQRYNKYELT